MNTWGHELERQRRRAARRRTLLRVAAWLGVILLSLACWLGAFYLTAGLFGLLEG